jgi:hypothetical protein
MPLGRSRKSQMVLKLTATHQLLAYADDVNLMGYNIHIIYKKQRNLIGASKKFILELNIEKLSMC